MLISPKRRDIITFKSYSQDELIRLVRKDGSLIVDEPSSGQGRGAYVRYQASIKAPELSKALSRAFKCSVKEAEAERLLKEMANAKR